MNNKPFVAHLIRQAAGGMQKHLLELVGSQRTGSYQPVVISPPNKTLELELKALGVPFYEAAMSPGLSPGDILVVRRLAVILRSLKPDILHIHGNKTALVGRPAAYFANVRHVVVTVHNFLIFQNAVWPVRAVAGFIERLLARGTDKIIAVSDSLKENLVKIEHIDPAKIVVIHNGLDIDERRSWRAPQPRLRGPMGLSADDFVVAAIGRLVGWKGHDVLIEAARELIKAKPRTRVLIAGDGERKPALAQLIADRNLEKHVFLLGHVVDPKPLLAAADMFVLPSINEPFGLVVLEAMAAGLPIVATAGGGVPEIITDDVTGLLVPPGDIEALGAAMLRLAADTALQKRLSAAAIHAVETGFSLDRTIKQTEEVYAECMRAN